MQRVSASYQREAMGSGFEVVMQATRLLFPLLRVEDSELHAYMCASSVRLCAVAMPWRLTTRLCSRVYVIRMVHKVEPFFALPWMITWFAHQLSRFQDVTRLYDVLLVSHPLFCLYLSAAVRVLYMETAGAIETADVWLVKGSDGPTDCACVVFHSLGRARSAHACAPVRVRLWVNAQSPLEAPALDGH